MGRKPGPGEGQLLKNQYKENSTCVPVPRTITAQVGSLNFAKRVSLGWWVSCLCSRACRERARPRCALRPCHPLSPSRGSPGSPEPYALPDPLCLTLVLLRYSSQRGPLRPRPRGYTSQQQQTGWTLPRQATLGPRGGCSVNLGIQGHCERNGSSFFFHSVSLFGAEDGSQGLAQLGKASTYPEPYCSGDFHRATFHRWNFLKLAYHLSPYARLLMP